MKVYFGYRTKQRCHVVVADDERGHSCRALRLRHDLANHSPGGAEWGYGGSGPAQLALAVLADALDDDELAVDLHQDYKQDVVAGLASPCWAIWEHDVVEWALTALRAHQLAEEPLHDCRRGRRQRPYQRGGQPVSKPRNKNRDDDRPETATVLLGPHGLSACDRCAVLLAGCPGSRRRINRSVVIRIAVQRLLAGLLKNRIRSDDPDCPFMAEYLDVLSQAEEAGEYPLPITLPPKPAAKNPTDKVRRPGKLKGGLD